jgi:translation initiation factor 1A
MYQTSIRNKKKHSSFNKDKDMNYQLNTDYEEYAYVVKLLGNCRARVLLNSGVEAIGIIRGALRRFNKRVLIENGDIIVVSKRDFQDSKVDIVHKFNLDQCQSLIKNKEISDVLINCYYNKSTYSADKKEKHDDTYIAFDDISPASGNESEDDNDIKVDDV